MEFHFSFEVWKLGLSHLSLSYFSILEVNDIVIKFERDVQCSLSVSVSIYIGGINFFHYHFLSWGGRDNEVKFCLKSELEIV